MISTNVVPCLNTGRVEELSLPLKQVIFYGEAFEQSPTVGVVYLTRAVLKSTIPAPFLQGFMLKTPRHTINEAFSVLKLFQTIIIVSLVTKNKNLDISRCCAA